MLSPSEVGAADGCWVMVSASTTVTLDSVVLVGETEMLSATFTAPSVVFVWLMWRLGPTFAPSSDASKEASTLQLETSEDLVMEPSAEPSWFFSCNPES